MKFQKRAASGGSNRVTKPKSRWAGVQAAAPRDPMPRVGDYRFRVTSTSEGYNQGTGASSVKIGLEVVASDGPDANGEGERVKAIFVISGRGGPAGMARAKAFFMAAAGFDDESEYDAHDPDGESIDAALDADGGDLVGRLVDCRVTRGNAVTDKDGHETGDYYREYDWAPVAEQ